MTTREELNKVSGIWVPSIRVYVRQIEQMFKASTTWREDLSVQEISVGCDVEEPLDDDGLCLFSDSVWDSIRGPCLPGGGSWYEQDADGFGLGHPDADDFVPSFVHY